LGLPISQRFVSMMGGTLELESRVSNGTDFSFDIPVEQADKADTDSSERTRRVTGLVKDQVNFRLLVVEDDENSRNLLVKLLQTIGFDVKEAINGQDAIKIWKKWQPHLIWMDIRMPVMDGYEATELIKSHILNSTSGIDTKIIALTASAFEEDRLRAIEHGGNDFVRKPFREAEIFNMLEKHLGVKFVYDSGDIGPETQAGHGRIENLESDIAALPVDMVSKLTDATELSDTALIGQVIEDIRRENNQLADGLSYLAENFAYDEILALVKDSN
jgi:CheY-like chemotaxis protein